MAAELRHRRDLAAVQADDELARQLTDTDQLRNLTADHARLGEHSMPRELDGTREG